MDRLLSPSLEQIPGKLIFPLPAENSRAPNSLGLVSLRLVGNTVGRKTSTVQPITLLVYIMVLYLGFSGSFSKHILTLIWKAIKIKKGVYFGGNQRVDIHVDLSFGSGRCLSFCFRFFT